jgi:UDP-glucose 4-epimerase
MRVLVTGGAGFIGSHLVEMHLARGDEVRAVDNLHTGRVENLEPFLGNPGFEFIKADITDWPDLVDSAQWADRIYHMAAIVGVHRVIEDSMKVLTENFEGTRRVLDAACSGNHTPRVILASSSEVYGFNKKAAFAESDDLVFGARHQFRWTYAVSKLAEEQLGQAYYLNRALPVTAIRFFNTTGPRQLGTHGMVVPRFVAAAAAGQPITIFGDGEQTRSFCDVRDTVLMLNQIAESADAVGEVVNVGNDREISMRGLAELAIERAGSGSKIEYISYEQAYGRHFDDIAHRRPDLSKLFSLIDYRPQWSLEETLDDLIEGQQSAAHSLSVSS